MTEIFQPSCTEFCLLLSCLAPALVGPTSFIHISAICVSQSCPFQSTGNRWLEGKIFTSTKKPQTLSPSPPKIKPRFLYPISPAQHQPMLRPHAQKVDIFWEMLRPLISLVHVTLQGKEGIPKRSFWAEKRGFVCQEVSAFYSGSVNAL